jgi:predicted dehydrogenase
VVGVADAEGVSGLDLPSGCRAYGDPWSLLDAVEPEAAIVSLPHGAYFDPVVECCARGIAVLKEKPLARTLREARELIAAVAQSPGSMVVASQRRCSPAFAALRQALHDSPSPPYAVHCEYTLGLRVGGEGWRSARDLSGGGAVLDMGYHIFDQLTALFGLPLRVAALPGDNGLGRNSVEHLAGTLLRFPANIIATVVLGRRLWPERERILTWGEEEHLELVDGELWHQTPTGRRRLAEREPSSDLIHRQLHEFVSFVTLGASGSCSLAEALRTTETVELVQRVLAAEPSQGTKLRGGVLQ